jgi:hypothetical protein
MQSSEGPEGDHQSITREIRMLCAFLRDEEQRRGCLLREVSAVRLWQYAPGHSRLTRWIGSVALERRQGELAALNRSITSLKAKIQELVMQLPKPAEQRPDTPQAADLNAGPAGAGRLSRLEHEDHGPDAAHR